MKTRRIKFTELKSKRKRFGGLDCSGRVADCKSAIQQAASLRYLAGSSVGIGRHGKFRMGTANRELTGVIGS
ncbi:hypothetical protein [Pedosphaera parvula]|uniref:Uncharacterized protein n=1 Tax=Pedosphaera parvula (strain Ellin514) TaxID=320771 RepID=B9XPT7_PEDPL|nr:hypothetical protein [Pedosphaera parvula]EEF58118.1 hypothetical protein Cflav_PD1462 [Pedosphaera parvula Ellin514]